MYVYMYVQGLLKLDIIDSIHYRTLKVLVFVVLLDKCSYCG